MDLANRRTYYSIIVTLGMLIGLNPFSIDMYLPGFAAIADSLQTDVKTVGLSLASFFAGVCLGQIIYGPIMDRFGRKKPLIIGLTIYLVASLACAFAVNIEQLIVLRFVQALGGCAGMVASRAFVRDIFPVSENARIFSLLILVMGIAPIIAPAIGGFVVLTFGWQSVFILLAVIAFSLILAVYSNLPESHASDKAVSLNPVKVIGVYLHFFKNLPFVLYTLGLSFATASLFAYITSSPEIFLKQYGLNEYQFSIAFSFNALCLIIGSQMNRVLLRKFTTETIAFRSALVFAGISGALFTSAFIGLNNFYLLMICLSAFMFILGILNPTTSALALAAVDKNIGMASALTGFIQMGISAIAAAGVSYLFADGMMSMATMIAICSGSALVCMVLVVFLLKRSQHSDPAIISS